MQLTGYELEQVSEWNFRAVIQETELLTAMYFGSVLSTSVTKPVAAGFTFGGEMYDYQAERKELFTEQGQRLFIGVRDKTKELLKIAGAVRLQEAIRGNSGSSWTMIACFDRMVELGELKELTSDVAGQHRVFVSALEER